MKFRIKACYDQYKVVASIISYIVKNVHKDYFPGDLIVRMGIKYVEDSDYDYDNYLLYGSDFGDDYDIWHDDWCEGQRDIDLIGFIPVDDVMMDYVFDVLPGRICKAASGRYSYKEIAGNDILKNFDDLVEVINENN